MKSKSPLESGLFLLPVLVPYGTILEQ